MEQENPSAQWSPGSLDGGKVSRGVGMGEVGRRHGREEEVGWQEGRSSGFNGSRATVWGLIASLSLSLTQKKSAGLEDQAKGPCIPTFYISE